MDVIKFLDGDRANIPKGTEIKPVVRTFSLYKGEYSDNFTLSIEVGDNATSLKKKWSGTASDCLSSLQDFLQGLK